MLWNLFNFFADAATGNGTTTDASQNGWVTWVIFGGIAIFMIVMMSLNQRKNKKAQAEMQSKIRVGATIMTIGGIVGEIIQMDAEHFWLATGLGEEAKKKSSDLGADLSSILGGSMDDDDDTTYTDVLNLINKD